MELKYHLHRLRTRLVEQEGPVLDRLSMRVVGHRFSAINLGIDYRINPVFSDVGGVR